MAPTCRLLTLLGPGGIGKTRLAIEAATASLDLFAHGAGFVALQPLRSTDLLVSAIADAMHLPHAGQTDPHDQLGHYLRDKQMLLVLDNFEHLLDAGDLISEAVLAIENQAAIEDLTAVIHPHPTFSETLPAAAEVHLGLATDLYRPKRKR